jgi:hypothetical protein
MNQEIKTRETETHIYFWKNYLSQWHMRNFTREGIVFNCCEQFMMYSKAKLFDDKDSMKLIMESDDPYYHKKIGRQVKNYNDDIWKNVSRYVVFVGNLAKFSQNKDLKDKLLSTGKKILVEASPYDKLWGVGLDSWNDNILDEKLWQGQNWLGKELRIVREQLRISQ